MQMAISMQLHPLNSSQLPQTQSNSLTPRKYVHGDFSNNRFPSSLLEKQIFGRSLNVFSITKISPRTLDSGKKYSRFKLSDARCSVSTTEPIAVEKKNQLKARRDVRNIAIVAHVDHGKTTLVDAMLKQAKVFRENQNVQERIMDSNALERERGITILSKNTAICYKDTKINIIDTPGHSDFGGEVERVLNMVEGVLLVVDSVEGPMPQTRFVLKKALEFGHAVVVVVNKIDRPSARPDFVVNATFELFIELNATDEQCDFQVIYASGVKGKAGLTPENIGDDLGPLFEAILRCIPEPCVDPTGPLQMLVTSLDYDEHKGRVAVGRLHAGRLQRGMEIKVCTPDENFRFSKVNELFVFENFIRVPAERVDAGDICAVCGINDILIGETLADKVNGSALPGIKVEEPTVKMSFSINTSPFAGRELIAEYTGNAELTYKHIYRKGFGGRLRFTRAMNSATETDMAATEENDEALLWEEWNASGSKLIRTAILRTDSSGGFSMHRECGRMSGAWRKLAAAFLPEGFPDSVTPDYMPFQIWDSLQGLSTYIRSMLSTQALLSAIGVGETTATVVGATFQWFLRDFTGMLGGILFTLYQGSNLDSKAKMWRLIADLMNDLGMLMDLVSPLYPASFVIILCLGSIARSFTGVASGATRAALTQHFALQQNAADISAKEGSQETMATMLGMLLGILLAHVTEGHSRAMWSSFLLLTGFHMFANYQAVRCLCLTSLNEERISILLRKFMTDGQVLTPKEVSSRESVLPNWISLQSWRKDRPFYASVKLGSKISSLQQSDLFKIFQLSTSHYGKGRYLLLHREGIVDVILHKCAGPMDILQSYIHALVLVSYMGSIRSASNSKNAESCSWMEKHYSIFISKLQASGWNTERLLVPSPDWRAHWMQKYI